MDSILPGGHKNWPPFGLEATQLGWRFLDSRIEEGGDGHRQWTAAASATHIFGRNELMGRAGLDGRNWGGRSAAAAGWCSHSGGQMANGRIRATGFEVWAWPFLPSQVRGPGQRDFSRANGHLPFYRHFFDVVCFGMAKVD